MFSMSNLRDNSKGKNKIYFKRPGTGISPSLLKKVLGKRAKKEITYDKLITFKDLK